MGFIGRMRTLGGAARRRIRDRRMGLTRSRGERIYPKTPGTLQEVDPHHIFRYEWAKPHCQGRKVLDYGCGVGYGSFILSDAASDVVGYDIDPEALKWARHYAESSQLLSYTNQLPDDCFDSVVCLECIEHVDDPAAVLEWIAEHNRETLLISTPEVQETGLSSSFHKREFTRQEFLDLLAPHYDVEEITIQNSPPTIVMLARCRRRSDRQPPDGTY